MKVVVAALISGFLAARFGWVLLRRTLEEPVFLRSNYRKHAVPTAGGLVLAASAFAVEAVRNVLGAMNVGDAPTLTATRSLFLLAIAGFTLLGLADDLGAVGTAKGFRGHVYALLDGHLTTGGLKLLGGGALALVLAAPAGQLGGAARGLGALGRVGADALVIALSANVANLLDRAPGRLTKCSALSFVAVGLVAWRAKELPAIAGLAVIVGSAFGLLLDDLHERVMLGDTGANALGASLGLAVVLITGPNTRLVVAAVLIGLNVLSEIVSFTAIIDRVGPLRRFDRLGTLEARKRA